MIYFVIFIILFFLFLFYMGIFHKIEVKEEKFRGGIYLFKNHQGHINDQSKIKSEMQEDLKNLKVNAENFSYLTIVYDDPFNLRDPY